MNTADQAHSTQGDIVAGDKIGGDKVLGNKIVYSRSQREELDEYLSRAVANLELRMLQRLLPSEPHTAPYKFLHAFEIEDADIFFGRDAAIEKLYAVLLHDRLTVVHARSGSGKTSLLRAGIGPRLIREGRLPLYARTYRDPVTAIKLAVAPPSEGPWPDILTQLSLPDFLGLVCKKLSHRTLEIVLILDQFEEFFIFWPLREQRRNFIDALSVCYADIALPIRLVIALRKDYFSDLADLEEPIPTIFYNQFRLPPMNSVEAIAAVTRPIAKVRTNVTYEPTLIEQLLDDLAHGGMELSHLQIACTRLYEQCERDGIIRLDAYEKLGRFGGLLTTYLHDTLGSMAPRDRKLAQEILAALVSSEGTKQPLLTEELAKRVQLAEQEFSHVLHQLVNARLLQRDDVGDNLVYELTHDLLAAEVRRWLAVIPPTGKQLQMLQKALLSAFPRYEDLAQMIFFELSDNLEHIAGADSLYQVTFQLLRYYAAHQNGLHRLIAGARSQNPGNFELAEAAESIAGIQFAPLPDANFLAPMQPAEFTTSERALELAEDQLDMLQQALLDAFNRSNLEMMVSLELDEVLEHIVPVKGRNLKQIVSDLVRYYAAQPKGLHRLIDGARAQNPGNHRLAEVVRILPQIEQ